MTLIRPPDLKVTFGIHGETFVDESPFVVEVNGLIFTEATARELVKKVEEALKKIDLEKAKMGWI